MAAVFAYVSGRGVSRVFRSRWSHEIQLHELDFLIRICIHRDSILEPSATACSCLALGLDQRKESNERSRCMQRKILFNLSGPSWPDWASFIPVYGRTRRILRWRLYVVWADSDP